MLGAYIIISLIVGGFSVAADAEIQTVFAAAVFWPLIAVLLAIYGLLQMLGLIK
jgi:hypothetical protein